MAGPLCVGVLASGEGTTLDALAGIWDTPESPVRIGLVVCDRPRARVLERARKRGVPVLLLEHPRHELGDWEREVTARLKAAAVELVVLAGFLSVLPPSWFNTWAGRTINLHPALLPRYGGPGMYGARVHEAVLASHDTETGATVHLVTPRVDAGPILGQARLAIRPDDTPDSLRARLHPVEVELVRATVMRFARGELPLPLAETAMDGGPSR